MALSACRIADSRVPEQNGLLCGKVWWGIMVGNMTWMTVAAVVVGGLAAGVLWVRRQRQIGRDSLLPLWRPLVWLAGWLSLLLGIVGIFLPVLPTVPFVLLTAACWSRTSPRFHRWLSRHRYFGPMVENWERNRAIPLKGKIMAWVMMGCSCAWLLYGFPERWWMGAGVSAVCLAVAVWMWRLPTA